MKRGNLRVDYISTVECGGDHGKSLCLCAEVYRNTVVLSEIAIELKHGSRSPSFVCISGSLQQRYVGDKEAGFIALDPVPTSIRQTKT